MCNNEDLREIIDRQKELQKAEVKKKRPYERNFTDIMENVKKFLEEANTNSMGIELIILFHESTNYSPARYTYKMYPRYLNGTRGSEVKLEMNRWTLQDFLDFVNDKKNGYTEYFSFQKKGEKVEITIK